MQTGKVREKILLLRIRATQNHEAFGQLYDLYVDRIYRFIFFKVNVIEVAQDITSETFLRSWEYIVKNSVDNFSALLYKIARNLVIDHYRKAQKTVSLEGEAELGAASIDEEKYLEAGEESAADTLDLSLSFAEVEDALHELKDEYREVIILRFTEELSISEIADILERNKGTVRVLIHRAIKQLRKTIKEKNPNYKSQITNKFE